MGGVGAARGGEVSKADGKRWRDDSEWSAELEVPLEEAVRRVLERAQAWRAVARAFAPPGDLTALYDDLGALQERAQGALQDALGRALGALANQDVAALATAHATLFGSGGAVSPRESTWADGRVVAPTELADMRGFLRAFAMEEKGELADHVVTECEFASALSMKEAWALAQGWDDRARIAREAYESLLGDHLLRWIPRFAAGVRRTQVSAFHAAAAQALALLVADESIRVGLPPSLDPAFVPAPRLDDDLGCGGCGAERSVSTA